MFHQLIILLAVIFLTDMETHFTNIPICIIYFLLLRSWHITVYLFEHFIIYNVEVSAWLKWIFTAVEICYHISLELDYDNDF